MITQESLKILQHISDNIEVGTFHHHSHIIYDLLNSYDPSKDLNYVEIGSYAGASACLALQRKNTNIVCIDIGYPISPEVCVRNIKKFNIYNNKAYYIKGSSTSHRTIQHLRDTIKCGIDVLFIDGDHSSEGVMADFNTYSDLINKDGYIVFDDYNDNVHSPDVKPTVDSIVRDLRDWQVIGCVPNTYNARPSSLRESNCFIIKRTI